MKIIDLKFPFDYDQNEHEEAVCAIGFFDGIHKGHQYVLQRAKDSAHHLNKKFAVMTFSPHPVEVLKKDQTNFNYLTTFDQKKTILANFGVDILYVIHFDLSVAKLKPQTFIDKYIVGLNISELICGFDFTYGHRGSGNVHTLTAHSKERFSINVVEQFTEAEEKVSSTRIRKLLIEGEIDQANQLLTRPLMTEGKVIHGFKRGREIGYPTANLLVKANQILPKIGVYYVTVMIDGEQFHGMASLGYNPTFDDPDQQNLIKCEIHIFDFDRQLYGQTMIVSWEKYIRPEYKFEQVNELIVQLRQDEELIRNLFS